jgi:hypothetical protein
MNPRYLAYCRAHGKTPDEMLAQDREAYPGGCMTGFLLWNGAQLREFRKLIGAVPPYCSWLDPLGDADMERYDTWLQASVP